MLSHRFITSLLYLAIQLVAKESRVKENNAGVRRFFVLFVDKRYISQVIHFNEFFARAKLMSMRRHAFLVIQRPNVTLYCSY